MNNILVIKYGALGDVIRTSYFLDGLYQKFNEEVNIYWLTKSNAFDLLRFNPYVSRIFTDKGIKVNSEYMNLTTINFDWILSLDDDLEVDLNDFSYKKLTGVYQDKQGSYKYTDDCNLWCDMGIISKFGKERADELKVLNQKTHNQIFEEILGIKVETPSLFNSFCFENHAKAKLNKLFKGKIIGLNLNAGKRWKSKQLRSEEAVSLIRKITNKGYNCLLLGSHDDLEYNQKIAKEFVDNEHVKVLEPMELMRFAAIVKHLDLLITSDSLAVHLGISQQVYTISFYAPTSAAEIDNFNNGSKIISTSPDYCNYKSDAANVTITAERIFEAFEEKMNF